MVHVVHTSRDNANEADINKYQREHVTITCRDDTGIENSHCNIKKKTKNKNMSPILVKITQIKRIIIII